jgi:hypothetical protein
VSQCFRLYTYNFPVGRTGLSVKELLNRADGAKRVQQQADVEELKQAAERMKHYGRLSTTENTRTPLKEKTEPFLTEKTRKDAPPYKVSVQIFPADMVT